MSVRTLCRKKVPDRGIPPQGHPDMAAALPRVPYKSRFLLGFGVRDQLCEQYNFLDTLYGKGVL